MNTATMTKAPESESKIAPPPLPYRPFGVPFFEFKFKKGVTDLYTNRHDRFMLREDHVAELNRVVKDYNAAREGHTPALLPSDVVNAALDFAFEHPVALARLKRPGEYRDALAREVYRKAFFHFAIHDLL